MQTNINKTTENLVANEVRSRDGVSMNVHQITWSTERKKMNKYKFS